jgi:cytidine deaminase
MDIWETLYNKAKEQYHPEEVSPFVEAHHVVCALESENGEIFIGFCLESCSGVLNLCAERVATLNMYVNSGQTVIKRMIAFRDQPPNGEEGSGMPCGACREFLMQLSLKNKDMQILSDYKKRKTITLGEIFPEWWGMRRYKK